MGIKGKEGSEMMNITLSQDKWLKRVEHALTQGMVLMIESIAENIDPMLDPLLSKQFVKKGKNFSVKIGSEDIEIMSNFKLYLQSKLINPHYKQEICAFCTVITFIESLETTKATSTEIQRQQIEAKETEKTINT